MSDLPLEEQPPQHRKELRVHEQHKETDASPVEECPLCLDPKEV